MFHSKKVTKSIRTVKKLNMTISTHPVAITKDTVHPSMPIGAWKTIYQCNTRHFLQQVEVLHTQVEHTTQQLKHTT
jgi:hypothetical protein